MFVSTAGGRRHPEHQPGVLAQNTKIPDLSGTIYMCAVLATQHLMQWRLLHQPGNCFLVYDVQVAVFLPNLCKSTFAAKLLAGRSIPFNFPGR